MTRYPWARRFIKQARFFSLLLIICGLIFIGLNGWSLKNQVEEKSYHPNPEVVDSLQDLSRAVQRSYDIIDDFQRSTGGSPIPESAKSKLDIQLAYPSNASLSAARDNLTGARNSTETLKQFLIASVQNNLNDLVVQLRAHASTLAPDANATTPHTSNTQVSRKPTLQGLFAEDVTRPEAEARKERLQQVQDLLSMLAQRTEKPENQTKLQSSLTEVHRLSGLLAYLTVPEELSASAADLQPDASGNPTPAPEVSAAKVADLVEASEGIIEDAITSKWLVDEKIAVVETVLVQEQKLASQAIDDVKSLYISFCENTLLILLATGIVAYMIQIAADILQAHIDNADNSFVQLAVPPDSL